MNKAYVMAMILITFNLVLIWFDTMGFFAYQPIGENVTPNIERFGFSGDSFFSAILFGLILAIPGIIIARIMNINAFAMVFFMEAFWLPYIISARVFYKIFIDVPEVFLGIIGIFTTLMALIFIYALIEMSSGTTVTG